MGSKPGLAVRHSGPERARCVPQWHAAGAVSMFESCRTFTTSFSSVRVSKSSTAHCRSRKRYSFCAVLHRVASVGLTVPSMYFQKHLLLNGQNLFHHLLPVVQPSVLSQVFGGQKLPEVRHFQRVLHLSNGELIADGQPTEILSHPELQVESPLPAPTLTSLSQQLQIKTTDTALSSWITHFISQQSPSISD